VVLECAGFPKQQQLARVCALVCVCVCVYLDFTGVLGIVDVVKGLFDGLSESNHTVIPQHQKL